MDARKGLKQLAGLQSVTPQRSTITRIANETTCFRISGHMTFIVNVVLLFWCFFKALLCTCQVIMTPNHSKPFKANS